MKVKNGNKYDVVFGSLGKGIYPEAGVWYGLNDYVFVGLDINYLLGLKTKFSNTENYDNEEHSSSMLYLLPGVQIRGGDDGTIPYATFQPIIGVAGKYKFRGVSSNNNVTTEINSEYSGGTALGVKTGAGVMFDLGGMKLFTELGVYTMSYSPTTNKVAIKITTGGGSSQEQTETYSLVKKGYDPNSNTQKPAFKLPFSSLVFKVGIVLGD